MSTCLKRSLTVFIITGTGKSQTFFVENKPSPPLALQSGEHWLGYGDTANIKRMGQRLRVVSGNAWITFDGEDRLVLAGQDIVLEPGADAAIMTALEGEALVYRLFETSGR